MGWAIGFDYKWKRDVGYSVPCVCDHPTCSELIDRGLSYVCGGELYGGEKGCGLYFCDKHHGADTLCERCLNNLPAFNPKPDIREWIQWKLTDASWAQWRAENPEWVKEHGNLNVI
jgi:hypothetical protein